MSAYQDRERFIRTIMYLYVLVEIGETINNRIEAYLKKEETTEQNTREIRIRYAYLDVINTLRCVFTSNIVDVVGHGAVYEDGEIFRIDDNWRR